MDITFFHLYSGVLVLRDSKTDKVDIILYGQKKIFTTRLLWTDYEKKDYIIQSITYEGGQGLMKDLFNVPVQVCQFHMIAIVMRKLRKKHQSQVGKELKIIAKTLVESPKNEFYLRKSYRNKN